MHRSAAPTRTLLIALLTLAVTVLGASGPTWAASAPRTSTPWSSMPRSGSGADSPRWSAPVVPTQLAREFAPPGQPWLSGHRGIDLRAPEGSEVRAVEVGVVVWAGELAGIPVVSVQHDDGLRSTYQPVEASVVVGQIVFAGDALGRLREPGSHCAPATCLHLGAKRGPQTYLDPALLLGLRGPRLLPYLSAATVPERPSADLSPRPLGPPRPGPVLSSAPVAAMANATGAVEQVISLLTSALAAVDAATVAT